MTETDRRQSGPPLLSRRSYLLIRAAEETDAPLGLVQEAVASTALEHPEWDMDEVRTWAEWERTA